MSAITINFADAETLKEATVQALTGSLSPEAKTELIRKGIETLLTTPPKRDGYSFSTPKAPIQELFEQAIFQFTSETAVEMVRTDADLRDKLQAALRTAAEKVLVEHSNFADALANAFAASLRKD